MAFLKKVIVAISHYNIGLVRKYLQWKFLEKFHLGTDFELLSLVLAGNPQNPL